ncbi:MAG: ABC transporter permease [Desulfuromonas sp.]|nr:MAG: ABC transporter permease [Desulfuromonas sp.]
MILLANIKKELLLLSRDRAGLLILFVMPMLLVLVLSLIQDNLFRATGETATRALFVNLDQGDLGTELKTQLNATGALELVEQFSGRTIEPEQARQTVFAGDYQFAIIVPADFSARLNSAADETVRAALDQKNLERAPEPLILYFDPTVRGVYRTAVTNALYRGLLGLEIARKGEALSRLLPEKVQESVEREMAAYGGGIALDLPELSSGWARQSLLELREESAYPEKYSTLPTSVQQNVPAWTLFGMFFIVIPLAGTLIRERQEGTLTRLMTMPVSNSSLLLGKVIAYLSICLVQFGLMLAVGRFILPRFGTPVLELGSAPVALIVVALVAALAACGYGILVGTLARSYEQASTFGAVSIVIAAALGGVMVPVYVMPKVMQGLSVVSPLGWGLDAFLDIFVRNGNLASVFHRVAALGGFFLACIIVASVVFRHRRRGT